MRERARGCLCLGHDTVDAERRAPIGRELCGPGGKHRFVRLENAIAYEQAHQIALGRSMAAGPRRRLAMIMYDDEIAGLKLARGAPFLDRAPPGQGAHDAHRMIRGQAEGEALAGTETYHRFAPGAVEALRPRRTSAPADQRRKRPADELTDLARTFRRMNPRVGGDAGIGRRDGLAIMEVVEAVDAVDEDDARLGIAVGRAHDAVPQLARGHGLVVRAAEAQLPGQVVGDGLHEGVGRQHREVEHVEPPGLALRLDEGLDVGMVAAHRRHHRTTAVARTHDGAAHGVPHVHEGERARGIRTHAAHGSTLGPERREVVADAAHPAAW